jgi:hypothetical protein
MIMTFSNRYPSFHMISNDEYTHPDTQTVDKYHFSPQPTIQPAPYEIKVSCEEYKKHYMSCEICNPALNRKSRKYTAFRDEMVILLLLFILLLLVLKL